MTKDLNTDEALNKQPITVADLSALLNLNTKVAILLEKSNTNQVEISNVQREMLNHLVEHSNALGIITSYLKDKLVSDIKSEAIDEKGLNIMSTDSSIYKLFGEIAQLTKDTQSLLGKVIWVIIIAVTFLGGSKVVSDWYFNRSVNQPIYVKFKEGKPYVYREFVGDTLWVIPYSKVVTNE